MRARYESIESEIWIDRERERERKKQRLASSASERAVMQHLCIAITTAYFRHSEIEIENCTTK